MAEYKLPVDGKYWRIVMEKEGSQKASYYICGELYLKDTKVKTPQEQLQVRIPISSNMYEALEAGLEVKGKNSRVFVSGGLELYVKVRCIN